jgi:hypothetical protein
MHLRLMSTNAKTHLQTTVEIELARKGNGARYKVCLLRRSTLIAASTTGTAQSSFETSFFTPPASPGCQDDYSPCLEKRDSLDKASNHPDCSSPENPGGWLSTPSSNLGGEPKCTTAPRAPGCTCTTVWVGAAPHM